jgi:hypothetical protein
MVIAMRGPTGRQSISANTMWVLVGMMAVTAAACTITPHGEWDPKQCSDGIDNDGDQLIDCADPDCWAFVCKQPGTSRLDAGPDAALAARDAMPFDARAADTGAPSMSRDPDDSGGASGDDATTANCGPGLAECGAGDECVQGICQAIEITGTYSIQILSATVPPRTLAGDCHDPDLVACSIRQDCSLDICDPDPYVVVTKNGVVNLGKTQFRNNTTKPTWTDENIRAALQNGDRLEFAVWDWDGVTSMKIYACSPDLSKLRTGMLRCSPPPSTISKPPAGETIEVVAAVVKL